MRSIMGFLPALKRVTNCFPSLSVTKSPSVPAPWAPQVSLFTVFPRPGLPKYRYLQCSRALSFPSIVIYSVPAVFPLLSGNHA